MNANSLKHLRFLFGVLPLLVCFASSCAPHTPSDVEKQRNSQFVAEDVFLSVTNGSSFAAVQKTLGNAVRHQFTVSESGHTWILIRCFLHTGEEEGYDFYQLLFRDGALSKTIGWIKGETEEYPYQGTTATRSKPWDIDDLKYVKKALDAPAVSPEQVRAELKDARETMEKYRGHGNIPAPVAYVFGAALSGRYNKEFPINERLRRQYDGCRVSIGMTIQQVDELYGKPLRGFTTTTGRIARIYGDHHYSGDVDHFLMFSYVAVIFDHEEHAADIFSDGFFCNDWDPGMPAGRRD